MSSVSLRLVDAVGREIAEVPFTQLDAGLSLNAAGEMTVNVSLTASPTILLETRRWVTNMVLFVDDVPVFGGYVAKRRAGDDGTMQVIVKEWSSWFERVWFTVDDAYGSWPLPDDPQTGADAATVVGLRVTRAVDMSQGISAGWLRPPLFQLDWAESGVEVDIEFDPAETNPQTLSDDIQQVLEYGSVDYYLPWREVAPGQWLPRLIVSRYDTDSPETEIPVGVNGNRVSFTEDTDAQTNRWFVVGEDASDVVVSTNEKSVVSPPLYQSRSWERFSDPTLDLSRLRAAANALAAATEGAVFTADEVSCPGVRSDVALGSGVRLVFPQGTDPRWPQGIDLSMRVTGVKWSVSPESVTTGFTLAAETDFLAPVEVAGRGASGPRAGLSSRDFVVVFRDLVRRVESLEARRG